MVSLRWLTSFAFLFLLTSCYSATDRVKPFNAPREWPCPNAEDILPCICSSDELYNLFMDCSSAFNETELANAFLAIFPFTDFKELTIDHTTGSSKELYAIPPFTFQDLTFEIIVIKGTNIIYIDEGAFTKSYSTLRHLDLSRNKLVRFPIETISNYLVLNFLIIDDNFFTNLPPLTSATLRTLSVSGNKNLTFESSVFTQAPSLTTIRMSRIGLQILHTRMFETLTNIMVIDLSENSIQELDELSFNPPGNPINSLNLKNNTITSVRHDAIHGLSKNSTLNFMNNGIIDLTSDVWQPIFDEAINGLFDFAGNPLRCGCEIAWMFLFGGYDTYRPLVSETTLCNSGEQFISLDVDFIQLYCNTTNIASVHRHS